MLRLIQVCNSIPYSFPVDYSAEFIPGMIAQLNVVGGNICAGVSDGSCPIGIIDDVKTHAFTAPSIDEEVIIPAYGVLGPNGHLITPVDIKQELIYPNIVKGSFISSIPVVLNPINGVTTVSAGTELNFDLLGTGSPNAIRFVVSYTYQIANIPGDDSTIGSQRVTVWFTRLIGQTTAYDTSVPYAVNATLFCSPTGTFTTRRSNNDIPPVAIVTAPPSPMIQALEFLWL